MRILSALLVCALLAACVQNPDPREPSLAFMQQKGFGGWIELSLIDGTVMRGELLAIDTSTIWVEDAPHRRKSVDLYKVRNAELFTYESDWGYGLWGMLGALSTISHGFFLVFSFPIWALSSAIAAGAESSHVRLRLPEDDVTDLAKWARYPQGMPMQLTGTPDANKQAEAWQLTKQAQRSAREGDCSVVTALDPRVRDLDRDIYTLTFMRDEGVRRCLGLPSLLAPADAGVPGPSAAPDASTAPDAGVVP